MSDIDYGPLALLEGTWKGDKGRDVAPEPDGQEEAAYFETLLFEKAGDVTNVEKQDLGFVRYHQVVTRKSDGKVFHNETGYLSWDAANKTVIQSFAIARGVSVVASGACADPASGTFEVSADAVKGEVAQTAFMAENARTLGFKHKILVQGDTLTYSETTLLDIFGRRFEHTDENTLKRA